MMSFTEEQKRELNTLISDKLSTCRVEVERRVDHIHTDMTQLRKEFHEFRKEFSEFTSALSEPLQRIATHMETLAGLPEAWQNFKGFMGFIKWFKENIIIIIIMLGMLGGTTYSVIKEFF